MLVLDEILKCKDNLPFINSFVSKTVPIFHSDPYRIKKGDTAQSLYERFKKKEIGGWCGLTASYMLMLLKECNIPAEIYNYGLKGTEFTHTVIIAEDYLFDPYFNKFYTDKNNKLINFKALLKMITEKDFSIISNYGEGYKTKRIDKRERHEFIYISGLEWYMSLMASWKQKNFSEIMKAEFNDDNPYLLMLRRV